jgi:hypothetical protein
MVKGGEGGNEASRTMLRLKELRPGDVLLSKGRGELSNAIARLTSHGSPFRDFSHATLVVTKTNWFESNDFGVGSLAIPIDKVEVHDGAEWPLVDVGRFAKFAVFRHPILADSVDTRTLYEDLITILGPFMGFEYPELTRLRDATRWLSCFPKVKEGLLALAQFWGANGVPVLNPGPFCSELVSLIYQEIPALTNQRVSLFREHREPHTVSPNDLADPAISFLVQQPNLVVEEDTSQSDHATGIWGRARTSLYTDVFNKVSKGVIRNKRNTKELDQKIDALERMFPSLARPGRPGARIR